MFTPLQGDKTLKYHFNLSKYDMGTGRDNTLIKYKLYPINTANHHGSGSLQTVLIELFLCVISKHVCTRSIMACSSPAGL